MIITNATLIGIDTRTGSSPAGAPVVTTGSTLNIRCAVDVPMRAQKIALGTIITLATAVVYVQTRDLPSGLLVRDQDHVRFQVDGRQPAMGVVLHVLDRAMGVEMSHQEIFIREEVAA